MSVPSDMLSHYLSTLRSSLSHIQRCTTLTLNGTFLCAFPLKLHIQVFLLYNQGFSVLLNSSSAKNSALIVISNHCTAALSWSRDSSKHNEMSQFCLEIPTCWYGDNLKIHHGDCNYVSILLISFPSASINYGLFFIPFRGCTLYQSISPRGHT